MQFYNGDRVRFIDDVGGGEIISFKGSYIAVVRDEHGFEVEIALNKLIKTVAELDVELENTFVSKTNKPIVTYNSKKQKKPKISGLKEIDLHIENLVNSHGFLTNYEIVTIQLNSLKQELNLSIKNRFPKIIIAIHGVGKGVLKSEIHKLLNDYECFYYREASIQKYGYGATEIILRG